MTVPASLSSKEIEDPAPSDRGPGSLSGAALQAGFGVYIHWPFCAAKCPYCDFNSHVRRETDQDRWRAALVRALETEAVRVPGRTVDTVFFGGGTPSLMPPETVAACIDTIRRVWRLSPDAEVTLEANPTSVEAGRFRGYADAGVNRVSMGVQALNDRDLKALGRMHSVAEARAAFDVARSVFDRVSFDLIYARMGQSVDDWRAELREALDMAVDHLSLYQLTIEAGTRFADLYRLGKLKTPNDDAAAAMYDVTQDVCESAGLPAYEISNHARPGAESRHNLIYWRYGDYVGVGPGAHGRLTLGDQRVATETLLAPEAWLEAADRDGLGSAVETSVAPEDQATEYLLMCLRLREGADLQRYDALGGAALDPTRIAGLVDQGMIACEGTRMVATARGRIVLNAVLAELLT